MSSTSWQGYNPDFGIKEQFMQSLRQLIMYLFIIQFHLISSLGGVEGGSDYFSEEAVLDYHNHAHCQLQAASEVLKTYRFFGDESVLDIGCGEGTVTAVVAAQVPYGFVHGIDFSKNMINFAKKNYTTENYPNLSFSAMDARHLDFHECFDLVTSFTALHWISELELVLDSIFESLKYGSRILFVIPCETPFRVTYWKKQVVTSDRWKSYFENMPTHKFCYYTPDEYHSLMQSAGFIDINIRKQQRKYVFSSIEDLCLWLSPLLPMQKRLPLELRQTFILEIAHVILKDFPANPDGTITVLAEDLVVEAKK